jgi:hypothetical protein
LNYLLSQFDDQILFGPRDGDFICEGPLVTESVRFREPPEDYGLIGGPLSESLWSKVSGERNLLAKIRSVEAALKNNWMNRKDRPSWDHLVELRKGFDYLLDEDLIPRPYKVFDEGIKREELKPGGGRASE